MASAFAKYEDSTLRKVLAVTLSAAAADQSAAPPVVHLAALAEELQVEAGESDGSLLLSRESLERALMARLSEPPATSLQWPVHYLIGVYARAAEEQRIVGMLRESTQQDALRGTLALCRQLAVSYAGLILTMDLFPQPPEADKRGSLQLLDSLDVAASASSDSLDMLSGLGSGGNGRAAAPPGGAVAMPPGFIEEFGARFADEGLGDVIAPIVAALMQRASTISLLGDFSGVISIFSRLAASKPLAKAITELPAWLPAQQEGRTLEGFSILGPFFGISCTMDIAAVGRASRRQPDVAQQCFSNLATRRQQDMRQSMLNLGAAAGQLRGALHRLLMHFLKNQETREAALAWLAAVLNSNHERTKMQPDPFKCATDGFMLNVAGVLLRLCEPFVDPMSGKAWGKLDARYICDPSARLVNSPDDTRLNADSAQVAAWCRQAGLPPEGKYHFICECFFMAARALQLGLKKGLDNRIVINNGVQRYEEEVEAIRESPLALTPRAKILEAHLEWVRCAQLCQEAVLQDQTLLTEALAFYRLSAAYLLRLASPSAAAGGPPTLPLPEPPATEFCVLPEYFVEDMNELLLWVGHVRPDLVEARRMEEFMVFFTSFLGAQNYVKNAYLRGKMVEVLDWYMPPEDVGRQQYRPSTSAAEVAMLFQVHPLVIQHIVHSLLQLYIDIEITDRHNAYYEKFTTRYQVGHILIHLWNLPQHRAHWRQLAQQQPKLHAQFIHVLLNDSQHLLQDALETLPMVQETERLQADAVAWRRLPQQEREDREVALQEHQRMLKNDFYLSSIIVKLMQLTAEDCDVAACYFDATVRNRTAKINDFFLKYLTVPGERKRLRVKDPEQYNWHPKRLITQLAQIHLFLYRARRNEWVQAVAADTDYYGRVPQLFTELLSLLHELGLLPADEVAELATMVAAVEEYKASVEEEEEAFEDVPEEFEDPLLGGLMHDPVRLPSGNIVERSSIVQQLLSDPRDPYSRQRCSEEDLEALPELQARIKAWVQEQRSKRVAAG